MSSPLNILSLTFDDLVTELEQRYGSGKYHAAGLYREVYHQNNPIIAEIDEFSNSPALIEKICRDLIIPLSPIVHQEQDGNLTKFVTRLADGFEIESVIVPMGNRVTLCISSQVGCRMGCVFCETGQQGFFRSLNVEEIVGQVYQVKVIWNINIRNIVFMGMGEPFDNLKNVLKSIDIISDQRGLDIAKRHITVSTVVMNDLQQLAELNGSTLRLAISLNAPNDHIRSKIMPVNRSFPMKRIQKALLEFPLHKKSFFFIEYVLIKGMNDAKSHAQELAEFLKPLPAKVNVIPFNPGSNDRFDRPSDKAVQQFCDWLIEKNVFVRKRSEKGMKIMAACGQLRNRGLIRSK